MSRGFKPKAIIAMFEGGALLIIMLFVKLYFLTNNFVVTVSIFCGIIILAIVVRKILKRKKRDALLKSGIDLVDSMTGQEFEEYLLAVFNKLGYHGKLTPVTGDYGADLILEKNKFKTAVQAKRYSKPVGVKAIQEVIGALKYYYADKGMVITNNYFTSNAENLARSNNIELWDRRKLIKIMASVNGRDIIIIPKRENHNTTNKVNEADPNKVSSCPICGNELVVRSGKYGEFMGCSRYPNCKFTSHIK